MNNKSISYNGAIAYLVIHYIFIAIFLYKLVGDNFWLYEHQYKINNFIPLFVAPFLMAIIIYIINLSISAINKTLRIFTNILLFIFLYVVQLFILSTFKTKVISRTGEIFIGENDTGLGMLSFITLLPHFVIPTIIIVYIISELITGKLKHN